MDGPFNYAVCTRDSALIRHLAETAVSWLQDAVDMFVQQTAQLTLGFAPHRQTQLITAVNLADIIWSATELSAELRNRLKAQIAFLGYVVNRDDYWSPPRGFFANPNMTTTVAAYRVMLGAMISSHPMAATWAHNGLGELKRQLKEWSDENGGWLEAPHYAMVSYDYLLGSFLAARNAGFGDDVFDERMKKIAEWFAKICTPPDPDLANHRHLPPIGNTYIREPTGEFGLLASLWKARDPSFASKMRWMDIQQGSPIEPVIGGFLPMFAGVSSILKGREIQPKPPSFASEMFPQTGIVLRSHFPSDRETQLYLIAGNNHQHYDQDSGTIWGKGRLIADDFGYEGYMRADDHSMVVSDQAPGEAIMQIKAHTLGPQIDYVEGEKGSWTRQIIFVKDPDPLGPNYFVISDHWNNPSSAIWRLWLTANTVQTRAMSATAIGGGDVDTDIYFVSPDGVALKKEIKARQTWGITAGKYDKAVVTQIGLIATAQKGFTTVIFPHLKRERAPEVTAYADGKVIQIKTGTGIDYVMLSQQPFSFQVPDFSFMGTVGFFRTRQNKTEIALGTKGRISTREKTLAVP